MTKELGDLRKIALRLEELTNIDSAEIPEKVGDLRRIANALDSLDTLSGGSVVPTLTRVKRIVFWNQYNSTFNPNTVTTTSQWVMQDADAEQYTEITTLPDYDFAVVESVNDGIYDSNGGNIPCISLLNYSLLAPAPEGSDVPISLTVSVISLNSEPKSSPAGSRKGATISLYKLS